jgi:hypothetical protein
MSAPRTEKYQRVLCVLCVLCGPNAMSGFNGVQGSSVRADRFGGPRASQWTLLITHAGGQTRVPLALFDQSNLVDGYRHVEEAAIMRHRWKELPQSVGYSTSPMHGRCWPATNPTRRVRLLWRRYAGGGPGVKARVP